MSAENRIRTRGLVVAALLSVASFTGAEKARNGLAAKETRVVEAIEYELDRQNTDGSCKFDVPESVKSKELVVKKKNSTRTGKGHQTIRRRGSKLWQVTKNGRRSNSAPAGRTRNKGFVHTGKMMVTELGDDLYVEHGLFILSPNTKGRAQLDLIPKIERRVSWGENTYHETHSGDEYDRTSWPDPYEDCGSCDGGGEYTTESVLESFRPVGLSIVVLYVAMLIVLSVPSSII